MSHARRDLVTRLDLYEIEQTELFHRVVDYIEDRMMPIVMRHAISGHANINSEDLIWEDNDALAMLIDVFSERGFRVTVDKQLHSTPESFDVNTGKITCTEKAVYRIQISFEASSIRRG